MNEKILKALILPLAASLSDAMQVFEETGLRVVLICNTEGNLAGLATEGDVRRALLAGYGLISPIFPHANINPSVGRTNMAREDIIGMLSDRVHFLPVLDDHNIVHDVLFYDNRAM